jgi:NAD(P)-dependent dehydrogenase (short-subunit alcohol dehydrogenase family)
MTAKKRVVFITGGMSGIGHCLAGKYAAQGCDVGLFDVVADLPQQQAIERLRRNPDQRVGAWRVDVTDTEGVTAAIDQAVAQLGVPDLVINSAGVQRAAEFLELPAETFEFVVKINLFGSRNVAAAALRHMRRGGHIAFVSSLAGLVTSYSYAAYCASKFAVVGLAGVLRVEFKPKGIAVSVICPPEISTPMVAKELETMHPVTRELKDFAGTLSVDEACDEIIARLDRREFRIIPGAKARLTYRLGRYLPDAALRGVVDSKVKKILDAQPEAVLAKPGR